MAHRDDEETGRRVMGFLNGAARQLRAARAAERRHDARIGRQVMAYLEDAAGLPSAELHFQDVRRTGGIAGGVATAGGRRMFGTELQRLYTRVRQHYTTKLGPVTILTKLGWEDDLVDPDGGVIWRSGAWTRGTEPVYWDATVYYPVAGDDDELHDIAHHLDAVGVTQVAFVVAPVAVGTDVYNDCLLYAVLDASRVKLRPATIKRRLGLKRDARVPFEHIADLEEMLKVRVNIVGEEPSRAPYTPYVDIIVESGHALRRTATSNPGYLAHIDDWPQRRYPILARRTIDGKWDTISASGIRSGLLVRDIQRLRAKKTLCVRTVPRKQSLTDAWQTFQARDQVLNAMRPSMSTTPFDSDADYILWQFQRTLAHKLRLPTLDEDTYLRKALRGGLTFCRKGVYDRVVEFDINAHYMAVLRNHAFPLAPGRMLSGPAVGAALRSVQAEHRVVPTYSTRAKLAYGIYAARVLDKGKARLAGVALNVANRYPHTDIKRCLAHDVPIEILDGPHMLWTKEEVHRGIFTTFVRTWLQARKQFPDQVGVPKYFANLLTGVLGKKAREYSRVPDDVDAVIRDTHVFVDATPLAAGRMLLETRDMTQPSFVSAGHVYYWILAFGREAMNAVLDDAGRDNVLQVQTDGFLWRGSRDSLPPALAKRIGPAAGKLKVVCEGDVEVTHTNRYRFTRTPPGVKPHSVGYAAARPTEQEGSTGGAASTLLPG